ncbi:unnamed protein product [Allacma fusca]|uniref:Uncharacterized protein n=1 Tax=Allacma fusca TaxID=39272 RepID=A0A8J2PQ00_9HEXA|nr:unnamed protein product [Allacma fusca]
MKNRNPKKGSILLAGPAIVIAAASLLSISLFVFYVVIPSVIRTLILKETKLINGTETWEKWTNVKIPILIKFYIFNVTNADDAENGAKFEVQEVGPYVWEEKRTKQVISIDENEDTVTYKEIIHYYFRPDLSVGSQEDMVNIVNVPLLAAVALSYHTLYTSVANYIINIFARLSETIVMRNVNIRELVFDGVELGSTYGLLASFGIVELPDEFVDGTFAFYNQKNGTPSKEFKVYRGVKNYQTFGQIVEYDHKPELNFWTNQSLPVDAEQYCNKINGSDGSLFPPFLTKDQGLHVFSHEICRSIYFTFDEEVNLRGVPAYRYTLPDATFAGPHMNENNRCFCSDPGDDLANYCDASGVIRLFSCKKGIPIAVSLPHFLKGSTRFHEEVNGMEPDDTKHGLSLIVEPNSGSVLQITKRVQISAELQRHPGISAFKDVRYAVVPLFWVEEFVDIDEKSLSDVRDTLVAALEIVGILKPIVLGFLGLSLISGTLLQVFKIKSKYPLLEFNASLG